MNEEFAETFEKIIRLKKELKSKIKKQKRQIIQNYQDRKFRFGESIRKQKERYKTQLPNYVFSARLGS